MRLPQPKLIPLSAIEQKYEVEKMVVEENDQWKSVDVGGGWGDGRNGQPTEVDVEINGGGCGVRWGFLHPSSSWSLCILGSFWGL